MGEIPVVMPASKGVRRRFGRRALLLGGASVAAGGCAAGFLRYLRAQPAAFDAENAVYRLDLRQLPAPGGEPLYLPQARIFLVHLRPGEGGSDVAGIPAFVGSERGGLLALSERCPHLGCSVRWRTSVHFLGRSDWFRCPCCGATFTKGGQRAFGPAPRSLDTASLQIDAYAGVLVRFRQIAPGGQDDPQRAVPLKLPR